MYGLAKRLGFRSAKKAWFANPTVRDSAEPGCVRSCVTA